MFYPYPYRRFGLFRRLWWFGIGVGVATFWSRHHTRGDTREGYTTRRCAGSAHWRRPPPPPQADRQPQTNRVDSQPDLRAATMPRTEGAPAQSTSEQEARRAEKATADLHVSTVPPPSTPTAYSSADHARDAQAAQAARREMEARARDFTDEQLGRLVSVLERLRDSVRGDEPRQAYPSGQEKRWV